MTNSILKPLILLLAMAAIATPAAAQSVRIGFINVLRIERESQRPQRDAEKLKQEFATREAEMRELHGKVTAMRQQLDNLAPDVPAETIESRRREFALLAQHFEQVRRGFVEDVERRKAEARQNFLRDLAAVVEKIARAEKLDLVVQEAVYASRALDLTDRVLKALDRAEKASGP